PTSVIITAPIIEEIQFRYILQTGFTYISSLFLSMNHVKAISIPLTSYLFGMCHLGHQHEYVGLHCINAEISGCLYGHLMENFGLWASIAAHATHNTIIVLTGLMLSKL